MNSSGFSRKIPAPHSGTQAIRFPTCFLLPAAATAALLLVTSCAEAPKPAAETKAEAPATPAQPVTAKTAFWDLYKSAHGWAKDQVALTLESRSIAGFKNEEGKAAEWVAIFGSPSLHQAATLTYSVVAVPPDIPKGVSAGKAIPWAGPHRDALPFESSEFKIDSDEAYRTAFADAKAWLAKHPDEGDPSMSLGNASRFAGPVWSVLWGSRKTGYLVFVSATTGKVLKPVK